MDIKEINIFASYYIQVHAIILKATVELFIRSFSLAVSSGLKNRRDTPRYVSILLCLIPCNMYI